MPSCGKLKGAPVHWTYSVYACLHLHLVTANIYIGPKESKPSLFFVYSCLFSQHNVNKAQNLTIKSADGVLETRTWGRRMLGATNPWSMIRPPYSMSCFPNLMWLRNHFVRSVRTTTEDLPYEIWFVLLPKTILLTHIRNNTILLILLKSIY